MIVLREIHFGRTTKNHIFIENGDIYIGISYFRNSNVRVADSNGNHLYRPREHILSKDYFVEWMITNKEISLIIKNFLSNEEVKTILKDIDKVNSYIEQQQNFIGRKIVSDEKNTKSFESFKIIPRFEKFFTFKKEIKKSGSFVEVTFKPGDVSPMEEHMYMLIPFSKLKFIREDQKIKEGNEIGVACFAIWEPNKEDIKEIVKTISHTSEKHKKQLIEQILNN